MQIYPSFPEWTELGQQGGLDPLGMQRPVEIIYQSLVPGISTITLRLRYYSFFCWMLEAYAQIIANTDPDVFRIFQRRCEILYALISAKGAQELGVTGIDWAGKQVANAAGNERAVIHFADAADPNTDGERYLKNKFGAFGAIYSTQMYDMGLLVFGDEVNPNPVCTERALPIADAFAEAMGNNTREFLKVVESGSVSIKELDRFEPMKPSRILSGSTEYRHLSQVLLGRTLDPDIKDRRRRETIKMLLTLTELKGERPRAEDAKWAWFEPEANPSAPSDQNAVPSIWRLYQACDLIRLAYEHLLAAGLLLLDGAPARQLRLDALVDDMLGLAEIPQGQTWQAFSDQTLVRMADIPLREHYDEMADAYAEGQPEIHVARAVSLIARLAGSLGALSAEIDEWLPSSDYFQSLRTELSFIAEHSESDATLVVRRLIKERVIKRHLWVASRKFRNQQAYTFLMEPADGVLRFRDYPALSPSSPRLDQALNFLQDLKLIDESGLTDLGRSELAVA